ncbi:MAG: LacI family DNA-binding transcriptional regulator [Oceanipulchritudo sp.]
MPNNKPPTLKDIAREAGVSPSTVSLALKGHPGIPEKTRAKVLKAADKLGYQKDANLSRLMSYLRHSHKRRDQPVIAYVANTPVPAFWKTNPYNAELRRGLLERATTLGYKIEEFWVSNKEGGYRLKSLPRVLRARGVENVIIDPHSDMRFDDLDLTGFACAATCATDITTPPIHRSTLYREETLYEALCHLSRQGYQRIGFVTRHIDEKDIDLIRPFLAGFLTYQHLLVPPQDRVPHFSSEECDRWNEAAARDWLREYRPELVIMSDQRIRLTIENAGMRVPHDIAVAYVDWIPSQAPMAGISNRRDRSGAHAIELVDAQFRRNERGYPELAKVVFVKGTWMPGDTVPEPARAASRPRRIRGAGDVGDSRDPGLRSRP